MPSTGGLLPLANIILTRVWGKAQGLCRGPSQNLFGKHVRDDAGAADLRLRSELDSEPRLRTAPLGPGGGKERERAPTRERSSAGCGSETRVSELRGLKSSVPPGRGAGGAGGWRTSSRRCSGAACWCVPRRRAVPRREPSRMQCSLRLWQLLPSTPSHRPTGPHFFTLLAEVDSHALGRRGARSRKATANSCASRHK